MSAPTSLVRLPSVRGRSARAVVLALGLVLAAGCGSSEGGEPENAPPPSGSTGVTQAGAQDFGLFRQILEDGEIPGVETLDALGFFAEHKLDYPPAVCGQDLCLHALLGVRGNLLTGTPSTLIQIGMNSPIDVHELDRPPLDLVVVLDVSGSMSGAPIEYVRTGLQRMLDVLEEGDHFSLVTYNDTAKVEFELLGVEDQRDIEVALGRLVASGATNLYDGLFQGFEIASTHKNVDRQNRVILLSDGVANRGITTPGRITSLAASYARQGIGLTTIGVGEEFDVDLMRALGEVGAGSFYFLEDPQAVREVFLDEVRTFVVPIALDARIDVSTGAAYRIREVTGTNGWSGNSGGGAIEIPTLFLARRTEASQPDPGGRRGGGGAILIELAPREEWSAAESPGTVGRLHLSWVHPRTGERHTQDIAVQSEYLPGAAPESGYFASDTVEKGFVMLNIFTGFRMAAELAADSDPGAARGVLQQLRNGVATWLAYVPDPDIQDDLRYIELFEDNLSKAAFQTPVSAPPEPYLDTYYYY